MFMSVIIWAVNIDLLPFPVSDLEKPGSLLCATQVVTRTTGMGIIIPDIIMVIPPGEDAAALGLITGLTAGKTTNVKADQNQKSDKLSVKYWREYFRHDIEEIFMVHLQLLDNFLLESLLKRRGLFRQKKNLCT